MADPEKVKELGASLSKLADIYCSDAFGTSGHTSPLSASLVILRNLCRLIFLVTVISLRLQFFGFIFDGCAGTILTVNKAPRAVEFLDCC